MTFEFYCVPFPNRTQTLFVSKFGLGQNIVLSEQIGSAILHQSLDERSFRFSLLVKFACLLGGDHTGFNFVSD